MQHDPASLPPPVPPSLQTFHLRLGGGTGGAGGAAGQEGGTGGVGQGAQLTVHTQSATFNGQPMGYRSNDEVKVTTVDVHCPLPSQYFEGREDILEQVKHFFGNNSNEGQIVVLLHGLGGVGKTQTALKFIQSSLATKRFTKSFKIHANSEDTIKAGYQSIAKILNSGQTAEDWLRSHQEEWLLLFDNADDIHLDLYKYLPKCDHGNILITSRNPGLAIHTGTQRKSLEISNLDTKAAASLFHAISGAPHNSDNEAQIYKLIKELHYFPLAIVQAAAYVSQSPALQEDIKEYITIFEEHKQEILIQQPTQTSWDYNSPVYMTWQISFQQLSPMAQEFLGFCSLIHYSSISQTILQDAAKYKADEKIPQPAQQDLTEAKRFLAMWQDSAGLWSSRTFTEMMGGICAYSLMTYHPRNKTYSMHPLVHEWSRNTITNMTTAKMMSLQILGMSAAQSELTGGNYPLALHLAAFNSDRNFRGTEFLNHVLRVYLTMGMSARAAIILKGYIDQLTSTLGDQHPQTLEAMYYQAWVHWDGGEYEKAVQLEEVVVLQRTKLFGPDHPQTLYALGFLATIYYSLGRYTDVVGLEEQVLAKCKAILGESHLETISAMSNLAITYHSLERYADAVSLKEQVLAKRKDILGDSHLETISAMFSLAVTYHSLERYADAAGLHEQVLAKRKDILGESHLETISAMSNLAVTYHSLERYADAVGLHERVLAKRKDILGDSHLETISAMFSLAVTYHSLERYADAAGLHEQVVAKRKDILGESHLETIRAMFNLAVTYHSLERYADAVGLHERVLAKRKDILGESHVETIRAMAHLASTYYSLERYNEALNLEEPVLHFRTNLLGSSHKDTILAQDNLAWTLKSLGQYAKAQGLFEQVLQQRTLLLGQDHPQVLNLAAVLAELNALQASSSQMTNVDTTIFPLNKKSKSPFRHLRKLLHLNKSM